MITINKLLSIISSLRLFYMLVMIILHAQIILQFILVLIMLSIEFWNISLGHNLLQLVTKMQS